MPPPITSFYHAIYKRLWTVARVANAHMDDGTEDGGFTLRSPGEAAGIFGTITSGTYAGQSPLTPGSVVADDNHNPLYWLLLRSLDQNPQLAQSTIVNGQTWPVMPFPAGTPLTIAQYPYWIAENNASPRLIDKIKEWIEQNGKFDDTPKGPFLDFAAWSAGPPPFPGPSPSKTTILFVSSMDQDNGVRPGSVPAQYWNSSRIYVCDTLGNDLHLPVFKAGDQRTIQAVIGNSSNGLWAGAAFGSPGSLPPVQVICNAYAFNTFLSDGVPLPAMSPLDAPGAGATYEQPVIGPLSYAVTGFRFDVDQVFQALHNKMAAHVPPYTMAQLGVPTINDWLTANNAHACVKVLMQSGEPGNPVWPTDSALPTADRHIAQRNLAGFDMSVVAMKQIKWQYFMMSQAGAGANALAIAQAWPRDSARFYLAVPPQMWARYGAEASHRGFEVVHDAEPRPFPDAVILRETTPGARLELLDHARERFFGMAFGVEGDPARLTYARPGDLSVVHTGHDGHVVGGFTLRPQRV